MLAMFIIQDGGQIIYFATSYVGDYANAGPLINLLIGICLFIYHHGAAVRFSGNRWAVKPVVTQAPPGMRSRSDPFGSTALNQV